MVSSHFSQYAQHLNEQTLSRRGWLRTASGIAITASGLSASLQLVNGAAEDKKRIRVAAILTEFTYRSHAHVILENFLRPYYFNGQLTDPGMDVVSLYVDQTPEDRDLSRQVSKEFGIPIFSTIAEALRSKVPHRQTTRCHRIEELLRSSKKSGFQILC